MGILNAGFFGIKMSHAFFISYCSIYGRIALIFSSFHPLLDEALRIMAVLKKVDINVIPLSGNLVDYLWDDRPEEHFGEVSSTNLFV